MDSMEPAVNEAMRCALGGRVQDLQLLFEGAAGNNQEQARPLILAQDMLGRDALFFACIAGHSEMVKELVKYGANVNQQTPRGYLPLHCSAAWGQLEVLKTLVDLGGDMMAVNFLGEKATDVALRYNKTECADFLVWAEAKQSLKASIIHTQQTITDPDKIPGKLTKDQKLQINNACKAKNEWLEHAKNPTTKDFMEQRQQLEATIQALFTKLNTPSFPIFAGIFFFMQTEGRQKGLALKRSRQRENQQTLIQAPISILHYEDWSPFPSCLELYTKRN
uniref:Ankyrin repeat domain 45 n=1 Tax=Leptobrachium leishanense TaxID=445787 RepID=A0A8C5R8G3_9ANUR